MVYLLVLATCLALLIASVSLYRYGCIQRHHPLVSLSVLTAWTFSFLIVFTIPLDVTSVSFNSFPKNKKILYFMLFLLDRLPTMHTGTQHDCGNQSFLRK
jgi:hypothetical protein